MYTPDIFNQQYTNNSQPQQSKTQVFLPRQYYIPEYREVVDLLCCTAPAKTEAYHHRLKYIRLLVQWRDWKESPHRGRQAAIIPPRLQLIKKPPPSWRLFNHPTAGFHLPYILRSGWVSRTSRHSSSSPCKYISSSIELWLRMNSVVIPCCKWKVIYQQCIIIQPNVRNRLGGY